MFIVENNARLLLIIKQYKLIHLNLLLEIDFLYLCSDNNPEMKRRKRNYTINS